MKLSVSELLAILLIACSPLAIRAVSPSLGAFNITREQFIQLDKDVNLFYDLHLDSSPDLKEYDDYLFQALRAYRHTTVLNQLDFKYTREGAIELAKGAQVDNHLCEQQLSQLVILSNLSLNYGNENYGKSGANLSLSVINFLESSARAESGILNGNNVWWGSPSNCVRARIPAGALIATKIGNEQPDNVKPIEGRYCIAHLKAKSWPKRDIFFQDRISIKQGVCLPKSCHSDSFLKLDRIREQVDYYARHNLVAPFNSDRYYIDDLYCIPDEDSPLRRYDTGTKLFILFILAWCSLVFYASYRYQARQRSLRQLRDSVDIRLIVSQKRESPLNSSGSSSGCEVEEERDKDELIKKSGSNIFTESNNLVKQDGHRRLVDGSSLQVNRSLDLDSKSQMSSAVDNDSEISAIQRILEGSTASSGCSPAITASRPQSRARARLTESKPKQEGVDFISALAIQSNIAHLLMSRKDSLLKQRGQHNQRKLNMLQVENFSHDLNDKSPQNKRHSQQLSPIARRASALNEALIKELQQVAPNQAKVDLIGDRLASSKNQSERESRANIDIFDGIKTFATVYIIFGHTVMFMYGQVNDMRFLDERMVDLTVVASMNALQVVSLFYIITGILLSYLVFKRNGRKRLLRPSFWMFAILSRYLRLLPVYFLVFWFARHVAPHMGAGAFWLDYRTDLEDARTFCSSESWLVMLTMSAADVKIPLDCLPQTWYLSNDFRTLLILPIFIMILAYNQTAGYTVILATCAISIAKFIHILRVVNVDYTVIFQWKPHVFSLLTDRLDEIYTNISVRLSTYLLGVIIGHLLYLYESKQIKRWPSWLTKYGMKVSLTVAVLTFLGAPIIKNPYVNQLLPASNNVDSDTTVFLFPLFKICMEICICIILLLMTTGGGTRWINTLLSSRISKILSNVSYSVFLVHVEIMFKFPANKFEVSYWFLFQYFTFFVVLSFVVASVVYVLFEMPVNNLLRPAMKRLLTLTNKH